MKKLILLITILLTGCSSIGNASISKYNYDEINRRRGSIVFDGTYIYRFDDIQGKIIKEKELGNPEKAISPLLNVLEINEYEDKIIYLYQASSGFYADNYNGDAFGSPEEAKINSLGCVTKNGEDCANLFEGNSPENSVINNVYPDGITTTTNDLFGGGTTTFTYPARYNFEDIIIEDNKLYILTRDIIETDKAPSSYMSSAFKNSIKMKLVVYDLKSKEVKTIIEGEEGIRYTFIGFSENNIVLGAYNLRDSKVGYTYFVNKNNFSIEPLPDFTEYLSKINVVDNYLYVGKYAEGLYRILIDDSNEQISFGQPQKILNESVDDIFPVNDDIYVAKDLRYYITDKDFSLLNELPNSSSGNNVNEKPSIINDALLIGDSIVINLNENEKWWMVI